MSRKIYFKLKGKKIDVEECNSAWSKFIGLMFCRRENAKILLFAFKKYVKIPIHSFFCDEFVAVWLDGKNKIIEIRKITPWKFSIKPKKEFAKLIEIPINERNEKLIKFLRFPTETRNI